MSLINEIPEWLFIGSAIAAPFAFWLFVGQVGDFHDNLDPETSPPWLIDYASQERLAWNRAANRGFLIMVFLALFLPFVRLII